MAFDCVLMDDPVVAADGHTYNRADIERWLKQHETSPLTNEPLEHKMLIPNMAMRRQINAWCEEHSLPALVFGQSVKAKAQGVGGAAAGGVAAIAKPAAVCAFSKKPLQAYCDTCRKSICINCAIDPSRCHSHQKRPLDDILSGFRDSHAAWVQLREGRPQQLQAECDRVAAVADAAVQAIRAQEADLKQQLQRACVGDLEGVIQEQARLLADVELAAASPDAAVADSEPSRCLLAAVPRPPRRSAGGGRFQAAINVMRLGCIVDCVVGGVSAAGSGFLRAFGPVLQTSAAIFPAQPAPVQRLPQQPHRGSSLSSLFGDDDDDGPIMVPNIGKLQQPSCCAFDDEGNLAVSDCGNHRILVLRFSDGALLRTIGSPGSGNGQFRTPSGIAFDGSGHILVADEGNKRVQMLRYSDGAHVRTIVGRGDYQFRVISSIACDGSDHFAVFDYGNARVQVFRLADGAHVRSIRNERFNGSRGFLAFDADSNLVVGVNNSNIQVLRFSDGQSIRTISISDQLFEEVHGKINPCSRIAFDGAGHILVADQGQHCVLVLRYADGAHIRTIGSYGQQEGLLNSPAGVAVDADGLVAVCDSGNNRVQVFE